jgi:hypothetical protein
MTKAKWNPRFVSTQAEWEKAEEILRRKPAKRKRIALRKVGWRSRKLPAISTLARLIHDWVNKQIRQPSAS